MGVGLLVLLLPLSGGWVVKSPRAFSAVLYGTQGQGHNQIFSDRKMGVYLSESGYPTSKIYPRIRITHPGPGIIRISGISGREKRLNWLEMSQFEIVSRQISVWISYPDGGMCVLYHP